MSVAVSHGAWGTRHKAQGKKGNPALSRLKTTAKFTSLLCKQPPRHQGDAKAFMGRILTNHRAWIGRPAIRDSFLHASAHKALTPGRPRLSFAYPPPWQESYRPVFCLAPRHTHGTGSSTMAFRLYLQPFH